MSASALCKPRGTTMTKLIISTLATAIAISSVSTSFAAPKQKVQELKVHEPIYFTLATGKEHGTRCLLKATDGDMPY